ncbi:glutamate--tRNA ligase [Alicyclobacillaceae bacterium I2511]|nr:glutamate--tRNA ligase [Alicyclobacillaceae bacterium I2511]
MTVRVRFAPSPTGHLHIGGVRTALFNYLFARHYGGEFILRFEDTDLERHVEGAEQEMLAGFRWLGLHWQEGPDIGGPVGPYRCTDRMEVYRQALARLQAADKVYPCYCTAEELASQREQDWQSGQALRYSGRCRNLTEQQRREWQAKGRQPSWRLNVSEHVSMVLHDLVRGDVTFQSDDIGDFVIVKSNGMPTYNFQVVLDDVAMKITHVIRGEEHLSNTPRQMLVYRALGFELPQFAHLPTVLNSERKKLSKRDPHVLPVEDYQARGYLPEALLNFLALLGWSPKGEEEILSLAELEQQFDLDHINHSAAVFDTDKLNWMAGQYMKSQPLDEVVRLVTEQMQRHGLVSPHPEDTHWLSEVVDLYREQMTCAADFVELAAGFFSPTVAWSEDALAVLREPGAWPVVDKYLQYVLTDTEWTSESSRQRFKRVQQDLGTKGRGLYMPVRAAVTGQIHGPDLQRTLANLPREWVVERIRRVKEVAQ